MKNVILWKRKKEKKHHHDEERNDESGERNTDYRMSKGDNYFG